MTFSFSNFQPLQLRLSSTDSLSLYLNVFFCFPLSLSHSRSLSLPPILPRISSNESTLKWRGGRGRRGRRLKISKLKRAENLLISFPGISNWPQWPTTTAPQKDDYRRVHLDNHTVPHTKETDLQAKRILRLFAFPLEQFFFSTT